MSKKVLGGSALAAALALAATTVSADAQSLCTTCNPNNPPPGGSTGPTPPTTPSTGTPVYTVNNNTLNGGNQTTTVNTNVTANPTAISGSHSNSSSVSGAVSGSQSYAAGGNSNATGGTGYGGTATATIGSGAVNNNVTVKPNIQFNPTVNPTTTSTATIQEGAVRNNVAGGNATIQEGAVRNNVAGGNATIQEGAVRNNVAGGNATIQEGAVRNNVAGGNATGGSVSGSGNADVKVETAGGSVSGSGNADVKVETAGGSVSGSGNATIEKGAATSTSSTGAINNQNSYVNRTKIVNLPAATIAPHVQAALGQCMAVTGWSGALYLVSFVKNKVTYVKECADDVMRQMAISSNDPTIAAIGVASTPALSLGVEAVRPNAQHANTVAGALFGNAANPPAPEAPKEPAGETLVPVGPAAAPKPCPPGSKNKFEPCR